MSEGRHGIGETARDLVRALAERAGLDELKEGLATVEAAARERRKGDAEVWSAVPLTETESAELEQRVKARFGAETRVRYHVEPALLGGVIVRVGDRYVDGSLATKLGQLRQELLAGRAG